MSQATTINRLRQDIEAAEARARARDTRQTRPPRPSSFRVWIEITDDRARTVRYNCIPAPLTSDVEVARFKLVKPDGQEYYATAFEEGFQTCTCKAGLASQRCKHLKVLTCLGLLPDKQRLDGLYARQPATAAQIEAQLQRAEAGNVPEDSPPLVVQDEAREPGVDLAELHEEQRTLQALARRATVTSAHTIGQRCDWIRRGDQPAIEVEIIDIRPDGKAKVKPVAGGRCVIVARRKLVPF